jgi:hypothetical protein
MLKKLLAGIGRKGKDAEPPGPPGPLLLPDYLPYQNQALNRLYNILFCDAPELFRGSGSDRLEAPWAVLFAPDSEAAALRAIAEDNAQESRLRVLAYNRLREKKEPVATGVLLGVIVEIALPEGLDVLAAYPDGRVRYINHAEKMSIVETTTAQIKTKVEQLLSVARPVIAQIGPWDKARLAPPDKGMVRLSFLVSDGLYFGQGPLAVMQNEAMAGPIIAAASELLQSVVEQSLEQK